MDIGHCNFNIVTLWLYYQDLSLLRKTLISSKKKKKKKNHGSNLDKYILLYILYVPILYIWIHHMNQGFCCNYMFSGNFGEKKCICYWFPPPHTHTHINTHIHSENMKKCFLAPIAFSLVLKRRTDVQKPMSHFFNKMQKSYFKKRLISITRKQ